MERAVSEDEFRMAYYGEATPPLGSCLFHAHTPPKEEGFLLMLRCSLFPYLQLYSLTILWVAILVLVYAYALSETQERGELTSDEELLRVSQAVLLQAGENYPFFIVNRFHYYRFITSMVLPRNFSHCLASGLGILIFGSYIEK